MHTINGQENMNIERILEYNRIYLEDTTVETNYRKEDDAYWKKYNYLESLCWEPNSNGPGMHERQIDRLVSC